MTTNTEQLPGMSRGRWPDTITSPSRPRQAGTLRRQRVGPAAPFAQATEAAAVTA
jgi:hypothetical protein